MPIATRPGETFKARLKKDVAHHAAAPDACPWFEFKSVSCGAWKRAAAPLDDPGAFAAGGDVVDALCRLLAEHLAGWGNIAVDGEAIEFDPATAAGVLQDICSAAELWELLHLLAQQGVGTETLKN